jgi:hypothetical protein
MLGAIAATRVETTPMAAIVRLLFSGMAFYWDDYACLPHTGDSR